MAFTNYAISLATKGWLGNSIQLATKGFLISAALGLIDNIFIKVDGSWRTATEIRIMIGGSWRTVDLISVDINDLWK